MKPKILLLLHFPPPIHGSSVVGLSIKESRKINTLFNCTFIDLMASKKMSESGKFTFRKILYSLWVLFSVLKQLLKHKPDLCYLALTTTGAAFRRDVLIVLLLRMFNVKRVYHLHNKGIKTRSRNKINQLFYSFVFKGANIIILSESLYQDISEISNRNMVNICSNGIKKAKTFNRIGNKKIPNILFLSNLIEAKGVFVLINACKIIAEKNIKFTCSFVGAEGDIDKAQFEEYVKNLGLSDSITFYGMKVNDEKQKMYEDADIFAFPTHYSHECFPLVLLESMQAKLPVISTFEGGIPDIVEDGLTGYLIPQKNPEALAEKLELLITHPDMRHQMGEAAFKKFEREYTFDKFEMRISEIFNELTSLC